MVNAVGLAKTFDLVERNLVSTNSERGLLWDGGTLALHLLPDDEFHLTTFDLLVESPSVYSCLVLVYAKVAFSAMTVYI